MALSSVSVVCSSLLPALLQAPSGHRQVVVHCLRTKTPCHTAMTLKEACLAIDCLSAKLLVAL